MRPPRSRWIWVAGVVGALMLAALSFGAPEQVGCGGLPEEADKADAIEGNMTTALKAPVRIVLVWDAPDGSGWKLGEGAESATVFSLSLPAAPPDAVVTEGALAVAHLVALPAGKSIANGPLKGDDADALAAGAVGALAGYAVIYKAGESAHYPWLQAFPRGVSCAQARAPGAGARWAGDAPLAEYVPVACKGLKPALSPIGDAAFANWALPPPGR